MDNDEKVNIWVTLIHAKDAISKLRYKESKPYHISPEQTGVLSVLYTSKTSPTPADISRALIRHPSSISIILNRMVAKGLITKTVCTEKKNQIRISLTEKGRLIYSQILENICVTRIMSCLSDDQLKDLDSALKALLDRANQELQK